VVSTVISRSTDSPLTTSTAGMAGGTGAAGVPATGTCRDGDFRIPQTGVINTNQIFWVDTGVAGKQRTDLPLYVRAVTTNGATGPLVECASCHDPHVANAQVNGGGLPVSGQTFLRISNDNSAVCTACHVK